MPIIKSTSRKSSYFRQPIKYILKPQRLPTWTLLHNIDANPTDHEAIITEFQEHYDQYHSKHGNAVAMYHEVLAFSELDKKIIIQNPHIMEDLAREYLQRRTTGLAMAYPHFDKHPHVHILLSQNQYHSSKSIRISQARFNKLKKEIEQIQQERYPELVHSRIEKQLGQQNTQSISIEL